MKKKLLALVAALAIVIPFTGVKAIIAENCDETGSCPTYKPGELVNFIVSKAQLDSFNGGDQTVGQYVTILSDSGANDKYVKSLALAPYNTSTKYDAETADGIEPGKVLLDELLDTINSTPDDLDNRNSVAGWEYAKHYTEADGAEKQGKLAIAYPTKDEIISAWGGQYDGSTDTYALDMNKVNSDYKTELETIALAYDVLAQSDDKYVNGSKNGFYTADYDKDNKKVWVVAYTWSGEKITGMTLKKVDMTEDYGALAAVYMDKTYDCHERDTKVEYACYECGEEYIWTEKGKQAETCTLVETKTSKSVCIKNAKTGIEEYIIEFVGVTAICGIALVLAKRKDLFKSI